MKKVLKWAGIILGSMLSLIVVAVTALYLIGNGRIANAQVEPKPLTIPVEEASLERGEHLVRYVAACISCHGGDLGGQEFVNEPMIGIIAAANLTAGAGGVGQSYTDEDWVRAIRHGIGADGRVLGGMPSNHYAYLSDNDTVAIIAYLRSIPPVNHVLHERSLSVAGVVLFGGLGFDSLPYATIDHSKVGTRKAVEAISVEYGEYLVNIASCADCHGSDLAGREPGSQPGPPPGPDLTSHGNIGIWTVQEFITAMKSGQTPDGRQLSMEMPWRYYAGMTDDELEAMHLFLRQLP
jgi:mono/diheme cytochrome c family protein